eukprot:28665-Prorocentrum_minimum.AAC.1
MKLVTTSLTEAVRTIQSPRRGRVQPFKAPPRLREGWFVADVGQRKGDEGVGRAHLPAAPKSAESPPKKGAGRPQGLWFKGSRVVTQGARGL